MNSGYSSLSTKLSVNNYSPPKEDESKSRFRKVSLINEADATEGSRETVDFNQDGTYVAQSNGTDNGSEYRWRNRFEGVSQYKPYNTESASFSDSLSYRMSESYTSPSSSLSSSSFSSALPDSTAYKRLSNSSSSSYPEERVTLGNRLSDTTEVSLSNASEPVGAPKDEWRRSLLEWEEPAAPAGEREGAAEAERLVSESERLVSRWDSQQLPEPAIASTHGYDAVDRFADEDEFTGVFKATLVELVSEPAALPSTPPASPDDDDDSPIQFDMDSLVDTLKSMGPSMRPRNTSLRGAPPVLVSSLPPIVEDAHSPVAPEIPAKKMEAMGKPVEALEGIYALPSDLGLKKNNSRDTRSPLELMKQSQQQQEQQPENGRGMSLSLRSSLTNSLVLRRSSDSSPEELKSPVHNGNGPVPPSSSRLDNSIIFGSHRSASTDQTLENGKAHRPLFRTGSLPEKGPSNDRMSSAKKVLGDAGSGSDPAGSRFDRFSFLLNSTSSPSSSLSGAESLSARMSLPPLRAVGSPPSSNSPTRLLSPTGSTDIQRSFTTTDSPLNVFGQTQGMGMGMGTGTVAMGNPILQRSFSSEGPVGVHQTPLFNSRNGGSQFQSQEPETEKNLAMKYRAFPDAYLTKEKEHGKLNPRPGKMYIFDRPGMCGQRIEVRSDVIDATPWDLQETISIRVVRGGWVLYEKPNFKGEKIALDEGDIELTYPFNPEEQLQNGEKEAGKQNGEQNGETSDVPTEPARKFIIGSLRRAVRDYSVPEICLFPEENAEGKKVTFRDTSEDARIFGFPIKANSIIINAGLWLVYAHPFFQGLPRVLEVGGFSNPAAWGVEQPYVGSLHPLKVGEPRVENTSEPKMVIFEKPYFTGKSRTISTNMRDFMTRVDRQQTAFMYSVGSLKVQGGMWVGYEKEGFRGHQYLLEEGEYHDWRVWGGRDAELRSVRVIRADLTDPMMVMFEQPEEEEGGMEEDNTFEVTEAIPDVELFEYRTATRSIHVLSGAWIAYSHVDYSGNQYILEKGFYNNCADWGSQDTRICSVQPIRLAPTDSSGTRAEIILYSEPNFEGECHVFKHNQDELPEKLLTKSCRVSGASWVVYENTQHSGNLYVLSEGDFPNLTSMGCPPVCTLRSVKIVPMTLSVPSISLFGLECLEGREITMDTEIPSMVEEGFNNHILSVRVNSGCWVICEHSNYRGRQFLLEPLEITNWPKFSSIQTIGSMFPVRQKRRFLRVKNKETGHFLAVQGGVEEMKSGRVVVTPEPEPMSDVWFYQDGFIKSKLSPVMSLQVMGNVEPAAKVVLWTETRQPIQTWEAQMKGLITSLTFPGCVLDVKGGKTYDKDHVVIMPESEERPSQQWEIELL
ncbi:beta/gamma crystallin domain-containing protein 2-like [Clinocottus analis]|uniref:beta/gamma crystallin domain-containing protein 2-like n=1 Tax=Clinocottus analis TaxID=304258 RepID=UPI0035C0CD91